MHSEAYDWLSRQSQLVTSNLRMLEVGSRNINGSARTLFEPKASVYIGVDVVDGEGVDFVGDLGNPMTLGVFSQVYGSDFDVIICTETLEHTSPIPLIDAMFQIAKVGTLMIFTWAGPERAPHGATGGPLASGEYYCGLPADMFVAIVSTISTQYGCYANTVIEKYFARGDVYATVKVLS